LARYWYRYQGFSYKENCVLEAFALAEVARRKSRKDPEGALVRRRHASHITVVLSKAAHSGPSVCLRARAPCPLRVSRPGADRATCVQQACCTLNVQCELQVLALPRSLGQDRVRAQGLLVSAAYCECVVCTSENRLQGPLIPYLRNTSVSRILCVCCICHTVCVLCVSHCVCVYCVCVCVCVLCVYCVCVCVCVCVYCTSFRRILCACV
jgi:hypothetical protein